MTDQQDAVERLVNEMKSKYGVLQDDSLIPGDSSIHDLRRLTQALEAQRSRLETCQQENERVLDLLIDAFATWGPFKDAGETKAALHQNLARRGAGFGTQYVEDKLAPVHPRTTMNALREFASLEQERTNA